MTRISRQTASPACQSASAVAWSAATESASAAEISVIRNYLLLGGYAAERTEHEITANESVADCADSLLSLVLSAILAEPGDYYPVAAGFVESLMEGDEK